jgi:hypothetical protein
VKTSAQIREQAFSRWKEAKDASRKWRKEAREDFDFYAGRQWSSEDEAYLREQRRPIITFNRTAPFIDAIVGTELNNRQETSYLPRTVNPDDLDAAAAELFTEGAKWIRQSCDADDHETEAYQDALICGMGWTETRLDYEDDPNGKVVIERISPLEMYWTAGASKPNLGDAMDIWRVRLMSTQEIKARWPKVKLDYAGSQSWADMDLQEQPHDASPPAYDYDTGVQSEQRRGLIRVIQYQWCERENYIRTVDPESGNDRELDPDRVDDFRRELSDSGIEDHPITRQTRRRWYQAFIVGNQVFDADELFRAGGEPSPGSSFACMTGKRDELEKQWHGLVRAIKDPQRWANKFFSQIQDVINSNAKGGIIAETDAFENMRQAEENWAKPDTIIWASPGAVTSGKIIDRKPAQYPSGLDKLMQVSIEAIPMVTGVAYEMLGVTGTNQPNVLERTRIGRSMTVLAKFASSLRGYRKRGGRVLLHLMRHFIPPAVLERATGKPNAAALMQPDVARFDVVVDQSPTNPNLKEEVWNAFLQFYPAIAKTPQGANFPVEVLLDYLPWPDSMIQKVKAAIQQSANSPEAQAQKQLGIQQQAADVQKTQADAVKSQQTGEAAIMGAKTNLLEAVHEVMSPPDPKPAPMPGAGRGAPPK